MPTTTIDFGLRRFREDPFPLWADLRAAGPVHRDLSGAWVVVSYRDVHRLLADPRVGKDVRRLAGYAGERPYGAESATEYFIEQWIGCRLPEVHRAWRKLVTPGFTAKAAGEVAAWTRATADALVDELPAGAPFDLMTDVAWRLPVRVMSRVLGVSAVDQDRLALAARRAGESLEPDAPAEVRAEGEAAFGELAELLRAALDRPASTFMAHLTARAAGVLDTDQLIATALLLFLSGNDTVAHLIGTTWLALSDNPDQAAALRHQRDGVRRAVGEALRYDGPACVAVRTTYEPVPVGDEVIPAGASVLLAIGSANRDETEFDEPDRYLVDRPPRGNLAFGRGEHLCAGTGLGRMVAETAVATLLERFPVPTHDPNGVRWCASRFVRGPDRVPVRP
ncbi:pikromycin synthase [Actinokineospora baliensis]|uniref:cytochrome P450 n=1 Tax=Actinokineospora baliensis TaxID=547056 RepID=UPI001958F2D6|nr:cytochrome P450 [Actinokineospora baliensis]MBM7774422.1 pikromycin synthase [Actinokineospora baliensis]